MDIKSHKQMIDSRNNKPHSWLLEPQNGPMSRKEFQELYERVISQPKVFRDKYGNKVELNGNRLASKN